MYRQHMECESVSTCKKRPGLKNKVVSGERNGGGQGIGGVQQRLLQTAACRPPFSPARICPKWAQNVQQEDIVSLRQTWKPDRLKGWIKHLYKDF